MAKNRNSKKLKPNSKPRTKPEATEELILDMARRYREVLPGDTPEDIYARRDEVHREMAKYSNVDVIYRRLREYGLDGTYDSSNSIATLSPFSPNAFPGYRPIINNGQRSDFEEGSVIGYEPIDNWVPEGYEGIYEIPYEITDYDNIYAPDFENSFVYYYDPSKSTPYTTDVLENGEAPSELDDFLNSDFDEPILSTGLYYGPSASYLEPKLTNPKLVLVPETKREISTVEEIRDNNLIDDRNSESIIATQLNEPFPTTLNRSVYSPKIEVREPYLDDDSHIYENRDSERSMKRKQVILPEDKFVNMSDLDKIRYELNRTKDYRKWDGVISPYASALLDYDYELLSPFHRAVSPLVYPNIPLLGLQFDVRSRRYVKVNPLLYQ